MHEDLCEAIVGTKSGNDETTKKIIVNLQHEGYM